MSKVEVPPHVVLHKRDKHKYYPGRSLEFRTNARAAWNRGQGCERVVNRTGRDSPADEVLLVWLRRGSCLLFNGIRGFQGEFEVTRAYVLVRPSRTPRKVDPNHTNSFACLPLLPQEYGAPHGQEGESRARSQPKRCASNQGVIATLVGGGGRYVRRLLSERSAPSAMLDPRCRTPKRISVAITLEAELLTGKRVKHYN